MLRAGLRGEHAEDASAAAHIEDHLVLEDVPIEEDGVLVGASAHLILQHLLVDAVVGVRVKVVVL